MSLRDFMVSDRSFSDTGDGPPSLRLVIDGREDEQGRALFLISALHLCGPRLREVSVDVVGATDPVVPVAARALSYDTGAAVRFFIDEEGRSVLDGARLYASIRFNCADHPLLTAAEQIGIPTVVAVQFPRPTPGRPQTLRSVRAAHDTRRLANLLAACLWD
ncbi:hypothetical protein [Methylobacterium nodulans]|uniref:hypothetical protein n=1 Tax=Methylobacterium nodulans TaxID=114616 RepID=UPI0018DD5206|nr:hypothetical protein [Methylobacterium nodulans]